MSKRKIETMRIKSTLSSACSAVELGGLNGGEFSSAMAINMTGDAVVGFAADGSAGNAMRAFRWTKEEGMVSLGTLNGGSHSCAYAVSPSGNVVVGCSADGALENAVRAFLWTKEEGMVSLGVLGNGNYSEARSVNATGDMIAGWSTDNDGDNAFFAFVWTPESGMQRLNQICIDIANAPEVIGLNAEGNVATETPESCHAFILSNKARSENDV